MPKTSYITRYDHKRMHGWLVRFTLVSGRRINQFFSDLRCGGRTHSLVKALAFRNRMLSLIRPSQNPLPRTRYARNQTGIIGVAPITHGTKVVGWKAYISDPPGKQNVVNFTYSEHGRRAKELAIEHRRREERRVRAERGQPVTRKSG
jgi:hypothetical protein